ncbi:MAG: glycosyltransferase [Candidatus Omnitrophota bacterium]
MDNHRKTFKMKALFISYNSALEPLIKSQGIPYLKGLSARGVKCILLSFERPIRDKKAFKAKVDELNRELENSGIKWYRLRYHKNPSLPATLFDILMGILASLWIVISKGVDIVHSRAMVAAAMGYVTAKICGKKFILDERGLMAEEYADGGMWKRGGLLYQTTRYFEKKLLVSAEAVVVLTENIKDFLLNDDYLPKDRLEKKPDITVIPCCVDIKRFNAGLSAPRKILKLHELTPVDSSLPLRRGENLAEGGLNKRDFSGKFVFLYTGSLGTWYLLEEMIDFFLVAKSVINNAHFLALTRADKEMVRDSWSRRGLSFADITIGESSFEEIPEYVRMADVGIFFIKPVLSKRSSCPIKFAEYLACGLPVLINTGIGDTDTVVEDRRLGVVIREFKTEAYLKGIKELLEIKKDGQALSDRCVRAANELFSVELGVSRYFDVYSRLMR